MRQPTPRSFTFRAASAGWLFAARMFAAVIAIVAKRGELGEVARLLRHVRWTWLTAAVALQAMTYVMAAAVWHLALTRSGDRKPLRALIGLALAMLFSNQAMPSVGVSGGMVVVKSLVRQGTPRPVAMAGLLLGLVTTYAAFWVSASLCGRVRVTASPWPSQAWPSSLAS